MVTNFPFIIQADFVLASSRETILLDNKWNQGILECVPSAFMEAFRTLVAGSYEAPVSSLIYLFKFIPIHSSRHGNFNHVREEIKAKLAEEKIIPIETFSNQKHFYKPREVCRLLRKFRNILTKARQEGVYILIQSSNLADGVSEDIYLELLYFVAKNWQRFYKSKIVNIPLIKYVASDGIRSFFSLHECRHHNAKRAVLADSGRTCSWMITWNNVFACATNQWFMPESTQQAIPQLHTNQRLLEWLANDVNVLTLNVYSFADVLCSSIDNSKLVIAYAHFLYHSLSNGFLSTREVDDLCKSMPLVDNYGSITKSRQEVLVPANVSKWAGLIVSSNPWTYENYIELGKAYLNASSYAGQYTDYGKLIGFLKTHVGASDIPYISPPNAGFSAADTPLTKENALLLLDWIQKLKYRGVNLPEMFLKGLKEGRWLKVTCGYRPPSKSFLIGSWLEKLLQSGSVLVDIPLIDESFYGDRINKYKEELKTVGVMFDYEEACEFIGKELMCRAASLSLRKSHVLLMLNSIQYLRKSLLPFDKFVDNIKEGSWLKTSCGVRSPVGSVLNGSEWQVASQISDIPFIDHDYFGEEIYNYKVELKLLGVIVDFNGNYQVVIEHLKLPSNLASLTAEAILLIMECIKHSNVPIEVLNLLRGTSFLKTNIGFKTPSECFLYDPVWGCILEVFSITNLLLNPTDGPFIDENWYGPKIASFQKELNAIGVIGEVEKGCSLLASHLDSLSDHDNIVKIYMYLFEQNWKPKEKSAKKIWVLDGINGGKWVDSEECIIHDPAKLFAGSKFYFLEDIYDSNILEFFNAILKVKNKPSLDDYVDLWNDWGSSVKQLSHDECCRFWKSISKLLSSKHETKLAESFIKLPATSRNDNIFLLDKEDAFIPDNLHMMKLFEREILFLLCKEATSLQHDVKLKNVDPNNIFNLQGLAKLILGFLACSSLEMEPKKRHEAVQNFLNLSFHETKEPINVSYSLSLSSGKIITKKANKRVRWESQSCKFIIQKMDGAPDEILKYATYFSEAISEGVLRENHDHVPALTDLITTGFFLKFKNEEIDFLMESKNLQIEHEDEEFLSSAFPFACFTFIC
ncbi:hypothetical protein MtrunA17_Chr6g0454611 [Medicago truncatula]|uniref:Uncharacterized protein n=1 Tax=Medicago truncatula TaxID=3880 RepID=A0A396HAB9_MEDTR|nr:hypothetical protein MtrunA17_Chr6g0454611 [Medicago truncatula]